MHNEILWHARQTHPSIQKGGSRRSENNHYSYICPWISALSERLIIHWHSKMASQLGLKIISWLVLVGNWWVNVMFESYLCAFILLKIPLVFSAPQQLWFIEFKRAVFKVGLITKIESSVVPTIVKWRITCFKCNSLLQLEMFISRIGFLTIEIKVALFLKTLLCPQWTISDKTINKFRINIFKIFVPPFFKLSLVTGLSCLLPASLEWNWFCY